MRRSLPRVAIVLGLLIALGSPACDSGTSAERSGAATKARDLRIQSDLAGWTEVANTYVEFDSDNLYDLINGGAAPHVERGLVEGIHHLLRSDPEHQAIVYAEDFGTAANAQEMFAFMQAYVVDELELTGYATEVASATVTLGGAVLYAHLDRFFFDLSFTGYADNEELADDIVAFLNHYQALTSD